MKYILLLLFMGSLLVPGLSFAQKNKDAQANTVAGACCRYDKLDDYKAFLNEVAKKNTANLDKKYRKDYADVIADKNTGLINELSEGNFLFDTVINTYLNSLFYYILEKNGIDRSAYHFFVSRSASVNASTYEDGTIICNLGLLNIIETESQLAMVLCHELAHALLDHTNVSIISNIVRFNSPEFAEKVKEIKKEKYNTKKQLEDLLVTDLFSRRRHNRSQEQAADSLGLILLGKTGFGGTAVPHLFNLLDSAQELTTTCTIRSFFKKENISVDESWFVTPKKISFGAVVKKEIVDTLKTHPDCAKRKVYAEQYYTHHTKTGADFLLLTKQRLGYLKDQSINAQANYARDNDRLSFYLFQLIQNDTRFPADPEIKTAILNTWVDFYFRLKNHTLGYVIDKPYNTEDEKDEYARLLKVLDIIDLKKFKEIALTYYEKNKTLVRPGEELIKNLNNLKQL